MYDYCNAWRIHYALFWINQVNPAYDNGFISRIFDEFIATYKFFFSPVGYPIAGHSICYRAGAVAPRVTGAHPSVGIAGP